MLSSPSTKHSSLFKSKPAMNTMLFYNEKTKIGVRNANENDLEDIQTILDITFKATYRNAETNTPVLTQEDINFIRNEFSSNYKNILSSNKHCIYVACDDDKVIGFAKITKEDNDIALLNKLYVLPAYQKNNCGNLLLLACMTSVINKFNINQMRLEVWQGNGRAIKYYEKNDFIDSKKIHELRSSNDTPFINIEMTCNDCRTASQKLEKHLREDTAKTLTFVS